MVWRDRIIVDAAIMIGKPVVRGTRIAVEFVLELIAAGWSFDDIIANYPGLTIEDIRACVACAREILVDERFLPVAGT